MHVLSISLKEIPQGSRVALYGNGKRGCDYYKIISALRPDVDIHCFIDSFKSVATSVPPVIKISEFDAGAIDIIIICSVFSDEIYSILGEYGVLNTKDVLILKTQWFDEDLLNEELVEFERCFNKLLTMLPDEYFVHEALGRLSLQRNDGELAVTYFKEMEVKFPDNIYGYIGHACALEKINKRNEAMELYKYVEDAFPENTSGYLGHGNILLQMNKYEEALRIYQIVENKFPESIDGYIGHGKTLVSMYKYKDAALLYKSLISKFPNDIRGYLGYGNVLVLTCKYKEALPVYQSLEDRFPDNINGYIGHADVLILLNRHDGALRLGQSLMDRFPYNINGYLCCGNTLILMHKYEDALHLYRLVEDKFPDSIHGYLGCGNTLCQMNQYDDALRVFLTIESMFPDDISGYFGHGNVLLQMNRHEDALRLYQELEERFPYDINSYLAHADILWNLNRCDDSRDLYESIKNIFPENISGYLEHGYRLYFVLKFDEAERVFLEASKIIFDNYTFMQAIEKVSISQRKYSDAQKMRSKISKITNCTSCEKEPLRLLFDHQPKCGGTSITYYLESNYRKDRTFSMYNPYDAHVHYFASLSKDERSSYDLICGHNANLLIPIVGREFLKATVLRDPIERAVSSYYYLLRNQFYRESMTNVSLSEFVDNLENVYIVHFSTAEDRSQLSGHDLVDKCFSNLKTNYDLVGVTEELNQFADSLKMMARLPLTYSGKKENATYARKRLDELDKNIIARAKERLALDMDLYDMVKRDSDDLQ